MVGRGRQRSPGANIGADDMGAVEPERVGDTDDELAHSPRREQRVAALRMTKPRQVDRDQVRVFGESQPDRLEGEQTLRPRAQQQGVLVALLSQQR